MAIKPIRIVISGIDEFSSKLAKSQKKIQQVGKNINSIGKKISFGLTLPIAALGVTSVSAANDFNAGMANVGTLIPGQVKRIQSLSESVKQLSVDNARFTSDVTAGLYQTISAFGDTEETVDRLNIALRAARAGGADTQSTLSMLSGVTKAYGNTTAKAVQRVADLAFKTVELGETSFPELAAEMGKLNSISSKLGVTQEEMFAAIAAGTGPLGNTADVATKLKSSLVAMIKPSTDMSKAIQKLGFSTGEELIKSEGLQGSLTKLTAIANKHGVSLTRLFGRSEALQFAYSMTGKQAEDFATKLQKIQKASGATDKAFNEVANGVNKAGFTLEKFKVMLETLRIDIGNKLAPVLAKILIKIKPLIDGFLALSDRTKGIILVVSGIVAVLGPLLMMIGSMASGLAVLTGAIAKAGGIVALLINPISLIVAGIMGLIGLLTIMSKAFNMNFKNMIIGILSAVPPLGFVASFFIKHWSKLLPFIKLLGWILKQFGKLVLIIFWPVFKLFEKLGQLVSWVAGLFLDLLSSLTKLILPKWLEKKLGFTSDTETPATVNQTLGKAGMINKNENETNIVIEDRAGVKLRTETRKGELNLEVNRGLVYGGAY